MVEQGKSQAVRHGTGAVLVGLDLGQRNNAESLEELKLLAASAGVDGRALRSEEHTSELQSH